MTLPMLTVAHAVDSIARTLIGEHHPHLREANILYVFTDQQRKRCDRVRLGSAAKMNALQRFLASGLDGVEEGAHFIMLIDSNWWALLNAEQRLALVDHELCHMTVFVKVKSRGEPARWMRIPDDHRAEYDAFDEWRYGLRGHDIEEFGEVLYRHGFWKSDEPERYVKSVALQLVMPAETNGTTPPEKPARRRGTVSSEA